MQLAVDCLFEVRYCHLPLGSGILLYLQAFANCKCPDWPAHSTKNAKTHKTIIQEILMWAVQDTEMTSLMSIS